MTEIEREHNALFDLLAKSEKIIILERVAFLLSHPECTAVVASLAPKSPD